MKNVNVTALKVRSGRAFATVSHLVRGGAVTPGHSIKRFFYARNLTGLHPIISSRTALAWKQSGKQTKRASDSGRCVCSQYDTGIGVTGVMARKCLRAIWPIDKRAAEITWFVGQALKQIQQVGGLPLTRV